jgi:hypothetical protein
MSNLARCALQPGERSLFAIKRRRLSIAIAASVVLAVVAVGWRLPGDVDIARAYVAMSAAGESYQEGVKARAAGREQEARAHWQLAYEGFERAALVLRDGTDVRARGLRFSSLFGAADSAFHGLDDEIRGRAGFERLLAYAEASGLPRELTQFERNKALVDLGRILAHESDPAAFDTWSRARSTLPRGGLEGESWYRARLRLLRAVLLVRVEIGLDLARIVDPLGLIANATIGDRRDLHGTGRAMLEGLAGRRERGDQWDELRRDARLELERLAPLFEP